MRSDTFYWLFHGLRPLASPVAMIKMRLQRNHVDGAVSNRADNEEL